MKNQDTPKMGGRNMLSGIIISEIKAYYKTVLSQWCFTQIYKH